MKKTIHGTRYNTATAQLIGKATSDDGNKEGDQWEASLYVSPRGKNYFIHGSGGDMTRFAGDEKILPMHDFEALRWARAYLPQSVIDEYFSELCS